MVLIRRYKSYWRAYLQTPLARLRASVIPWVSVPVVGIALFLIVEHNIALKFRECVSQISVAQVAKERGENSQVIGGAVRAQTICSVDLVDRHSGFFGFLTALALAVFAAIQIRIYREQTSVMNATLKANRIAVSAASRSAKAAEDAVGHAKKTAEIELRPWITLSPTIGSGLVFDAATATTRINCAIKNVGRAVANGVVIHSVCWADNANMVGVPFGEGDRRHEHRREIYWSAPAVATGQTLLPNQILTYVVTLSVFNDEIAAAIAFGSIHDGVSFFGSVRVYYLAGGQPSYTEQEFQVAYVPIRDSNSYKEPIHPNLVSIERDQLEVRLIRGTAV